MLKVLKKLLKRILKMLKIGSTEIATSATVTKDGTDIAKVDKEGTVVWEKANGNPNPVWSANKTITAQYEGEDGLTHKFSATFQNNQIVGFTYYGDSPGTFYPLTYNSTNGFTGVVGAYWYDTHDTNIPMNEFLLTFVVNDPLKLRIIANYWEDNPIAMGGIIQNDLRYDKNTNKFSGAAAADYPSGYSYVNGDRLGIYATEDGGLKLGIGNSNAGIVSVMHYS